MFAYVIPYDLSSTHPDAHTAFIKHAATYGLSTWVEAEGAMHKLPNTTLSGKFATIGEAEAAFDAALRATRLELWMSTIALTKRFIIPQGAPGLVLSDSQQPKFALGDLLSPRARRVQTLGMLGRALG